MSQDDNNLMTAAPPAPAYSQESIQMIPKANKTHLISYVQLVILLSAHNLKTFIVTIFIKIGLL